MQIPDIDIILIKGAPASGKSLTAKELSKFFPKGVRIEVDTIRSMVIQVDWTNQKEHINILNLSAKLAYEFYCLEFRPIIIVDTFSGDKMNTFFEHLKSLKKDWIIAIFGLYANESEIKKRINLRTDDQFKNFNICKKLNDDTLKYKHKEEIQIDTTHFESNETAKIIYDSLALKAHS